jgi:hypothetical protein
LLNNENDLRKGVNFTSSDPYLIKLFLRWLQDLGGYENDELNFDIFINKFGRTKKLTETDKIDRIKQIIRYWAEVTEAPKEKFIHIYFKEKPVSNGKKKIDLKEYNKANFGFLRIRVKSSSMLARQIAGWMRGIREFYWK